MADFNGHSLEKFGAETIRVQTTFWLARLYNVAKMSTASFCRRGGEGLRKEDADAYGLLGLMPELC